MKIVFEEDKSFLELEQKEDGKVRLILCAANGYKKTIMLSVDLNQAQLDELKKFLLAPV